MAQITELYRHPIKAHGREALSSATLTTGNTFPWDRVWAVAHEASKVTPSNTDWARCVNFSRAAKALGLMAITAQMDTSAGIVHLHHPDLGAVSGNPDEPADAARLIAWAKPLMPADRAQSVFIAKATDRGMTDSPFPSISINTHGSLRGLSERAGMELSQHRWRGNIWLDGVEPWAEFDWIGRDLQVGKVRLAVRARITRCKATTANPETGRFDLDTLALLNKGYGHQDFGVYAEVITGGKIRTGDKVEIL
jgi:uncharacterized protein YcbX